MVVAEEREREKEHSAIVSDTETTESIALRRRDNSRSGLARVARDSVWSSCLRMLAEYSALIVGRVHQQGK